MNPQGLPRLIFRVHAVRRMFERGISEEDVRAVLATGETIESYPSDTPYPRLVRYAPVARGSGG